MCWSRRSWIPHVSCRPLRVWHCGGCAVGAVASGLACGHGGPATPHYATPPPLEVGRRPPGGGGGIGGGVQGGARGERRSGRSVGGSHERNFGGSCSAQSTWLAWPNQLAAKVRVRFMVMVWLEGGQGEVRGACAPPPPPHPKLPHLEPPPNVEKASKPAVKQQ